MTPSNGRRVGSSEHTLDVLILHCLAREVLGVALEELIRGRVEAAAGRYVVAPSTDRVNARWFLLLAVLLLGGLGDRGTGVGGSFSGNEFFDVLILHKAALEGLVVALQELRFGRIQAARHIRDGRIAGLTNHADAFGRLLLFVLVVLVLFITFDGIDFDDISLDSIDFGDFSFDSPAADLLASDLRFDGRQA